MKLWERFILQPRSYYGNSSGSAGKCYLVVWDDVEDHYVYDNPKTGSYAKFNNSKKAFEFLNKICPECE